MESPFPYEIDKLIDVEEIILVVRGRKAIPKEERPKVVAAAKKLRKLLRMKQHMEATATRELEPSKAHALSAERCKWFQIPSNPHMYRARGAGPQMRIEDENSLPN